MFVRFMYSSFNSNAEKHRKEEVDDRNNQGDEGSDSMKKSNDFSASFEAAAAEEWIDFEHLKILLFFTVFHERTIEW